MIQEMYNFSLAYFKFVTLSISLKTKGELAVIALLAGFIFVFVALHVCLNYENNLNQMGQGCCFI